MMLDTADNKIFFPRFYDIDTICSYDNSGQLKFDVDIEMEQGYWNTSSSRLWTRIRDLMHDDIVTTYNNMRQNGVSYENMMKYIYDEQIAKIPQTYYNKDYDVKYAPFADSYIGMAHGDTYEHVKRWLKQRFAFVDTLFDYAPSYNNDILTIRVNTTEEITLHLETYTPVYQHLSWYNGQMDKKKIDGKTSITFSGKVQAATDQEVLIYGGSNIKKITGIQSGNPNRLILGSATKLTELDASNCPLLSEINMNKANLSPHEYLNKVNLSNCPLLEGNLRLNNSPLIQELDIRGTGITGMNLPSSIRNLQVLRLPNTMTELTLNDAGMLHTLEFDEGVALQSISMTNCNALTNVVNFDLLQTPSIVLNNSYNTAAELYFRDTTNLSLSNMSNLERVIYTPNNEYETFEMINVANAPNYKVTTFNCPKLSTFMTTAPYRESYNNCGMTDKEVVNYIEKDYRPEMLKDYEIENAGSNAGNLYSMGGCTYTDFIEIQNSSDYTITTGTTNATVLRVAEYDENKTYIGISQSSYELNITTSSTTKYIRISVRYPDYIQVNGLFPTYGYVQIKDYGDIQPNTTFTANSIDISNTQFTDVKLLCTTDTNTLKLPTTVKNFYCDSSFDLDTDWLEDGEYDVVHGELVEPYTTDYEDEVNRYIQEVIYYPKGDSVITTDFIKVVPGTDVSVVRVSGGFGYTIRIEEYKSADASNGNGSTSNMDNVSTTLKLDTNYIKLILYCSQCDYNVTLTKVKTPNLVPSSADGSLIFSMYAPSNTVAPASGTWDLHGLEFDNFHTFGMNNDVKGEYDKYVDYFYEPSSYKTSLISVHNFNQTICVDSVNNSKYTRYIYFYDKDGLYISNNYDFTGITVSIPSNAEYISVSIKYTNTIDDAIGVSLNGVLYKLGEQITDGDIIKDFYKSPNPKSLSMPSRYDDYNITIKNAYIKPTTHNTMLYPLLVNEDNPITGTLDYTNYEGNNLSWSFAYVNMNKVNIVQPKDELLNTYEYRYNAFYETEYEFDDPNEVLRYITSSSNLLPTFNEGFTYTYDKLDNNDGTYIYRIYANDPTLLTSFELEKVPYLRITNAENLLSPIDLTKYETISISESYYDITELYFREATNLTLTNMPYLERVIYLPNDEYEVFEIINVVNSKDYIITTSECPRLTTFMTTASHRESYNNEDAIAEVITEFTNTDNELFTNEYVFSKTYWEEDGTEVQGSVNLLHYEIPSIEDNVKAIHMVQGLDSTNRVTFFNDDKFISCEVITTACELDFKLHRDCNRIVFICEREGIVSSVVESILTTTLVKEYGSVEPNIIFNANTLDISNTQFTDVKLLCTTDLNVLKLPTTVKNFYCDSSFDLDTDYLTDGEYNYIHNDLVKEYTTNYEGEIGRSKYNTILVSNTTLENVQVLGGTILTYTSNGTLAEFIKEYDSNDNLLVSNNTYEIKTMDNSIGLYTGSIILNNDTSYISITANNTSEFKATLMELYSPNLIPSSSDGSLIFSMYAPSKAPVPASNTWDLYGLEFDNFHTFGMNNDVKGELEVKELRNNTTIYRILDERYNSNTLYGLSYGTASGTPGSYSAGCSISPILLDEDITSITITTSNGCGMFHYNSTDYDGVTATAQGFSGGTTSSGATSGVVSEKRLRLITFHDDTDLEWFDMTLVGNETKTIRYYMEDMIIVDVNDERRKTWNTVSYDTIYETTSLSMPSRYNNYNVTIKNANIKPTTHNTMLYPLLVNEDNPIEGKLDYTDYNGEYLSWSFAYTNTNKVNIIQPKDELLNTYEYRYNAFYKTEYEFNNPNEVMEYTTTSSDLLPIFNEGFTYAYDKIDNDNGTYTYKIYANDISSLTSFELEKVPYLRIINAENLVSPIDLTKYEVVEIDNSYNSISELYFRDATDLTLNNISNLERVIYVPNSEYDTFELINITNASNYNIVTSNCPKLSTFMTTAPYRESYMLNAEYLGLKLPGKTRTELEYIQSDGNQYFDIGIVAKIGDTIVMDLDMDKRADANYDYFIGGNVAAVQFNNAHATQLSVRYCTITPRETAVGDISACNVSERNTYTVKFTQNEDHTLKIFAGAYQGTFETQNKGAGKLYSFKYYSNNRLIRDYIPCKDENDIVCLYDNIADKFLYPDGTLIAGSEVDMSDRLVEVWDKNYGDIKPNTTFTANSIDISSTQFTDVKLLCTTDTNTLKLPTTVKNFYCDSSFDLDTDYLEDGEYDVVHGELVEPYTTDYEGEVVRFSSNEASLLMKDICTIPNSYINDKTGEAVYHYTYSLSDFIEVVPSTQIKLNFWVCRVSEFNADKSYIKNTVLYNNGTQKLILDSNCKYIRVYVEPSYLDDINVITCTPLVMYVPNLTPSSADGSLIFSMYAPNNTVAPVSGTWDLKGLEFDNFHTFGMNNDVIQDSEGNIIMPSRYDDYNITIKNANISPTTHNTMLYPLLVNEDNPITGILDYTNYAGKHLSWSFAYTDEEYVDIIQPKDELINSYKYKYNAYYKTEYEFDNPYEIARYTSSASGLLPTFNSEFTYTYDEIDNEDGIYTIKIYADSFDNLPTSIKFDQLYANDLRLLTVDKLQITSAITNMRHMFRNNRALTHVNTDGWDTSNVIDMNEMFCNCYKLTSLDVSNFNTDKLIDMGNMFIGCSSLTSLDLSGFNTSNVTYMGSMVQGCKNLTSLDVSGFDTSKVANMANMFYDCNSLTSLDVSGFDTSKVTGMQGMFQNCNNLTSLDVSGFDTSKVANMAAMFIGCSKLTSLDVSGFDTGEVTDMEGMFQRCSSLKEAKGIENWDCSKVVKFGSMFQGATVFGGDLDLRNWKVGQNTTVTTIYSFMNGCANLKSVDMSGWVLPDNTNFSNFMANQSSLHTVKVIGWSAINIQNLCSLIGSYVGGTIYGDVIIDESYLKNNWIYENVLEVAIYTCNTSGILPTFNSEFTYTHAEVDNGDGTYTTKISADSLDNLPTQISFYTKSALLSVERMNVSKVTSAQGMFYQCSNVTHINSSNWDTSSMTTMNNMFNGCSKLTSLDVSGFDTSNVTNMFSMFSNCSKLTSLDVSGFDTGNVTTMSGMFKGCSSLTSLDVSSFDTGEVTNMANMFHDCKNLTSLDVSGFDTSKVTAMNDMFVSCNGLTSLDLSGFDTSKVTDMSSMFHSCNNLHTIILPNTVPTNPFSMARMFQSCNVLTDITWTDKVIKPTSLNYTFYGCRTLTSLDLSKWDTSELTLTANMLEGCLSLTSLNTSNWNTGKVTNMAGMFVGCEDLIEVIGIENWDTSQVNNMSSMFNTCQMLTSLDVSDWVVDKVTNFQSTFHLCKSLTTLDVSNWNVTKDNISGMFRGCASLTKLNLSNWGVKLTGLWYVFQGCSSLTSINLNNVIGELGTIDGVFADCFNLKTVYANNCTTTNLEKLIAKLPVVTPTSTIQGSVLIDESLLPSGWVYDNALEIAVYTCNTSGILPKFNKEFTTYSHSEVDNGDGTYTTKIATDSLDNLPTGISFNGISDNTYITTLLRVDKLNTSQMTNMESMFRDCRAMTYINIRSFDTSKVTKMDAMFRACIKLETIDGIEDLNTSQVTGMSSMFQECKIITSLDLHKWDVSKVKNADTMFRDFTSLTSLNIEGWEFHSFDNQYGLAQMFQGCTALAEIKGIENLLPSDGVFKRLDNMFNGCSSLTTLDLSSWNTSNVTNMSMMFKNCNKLTTLNVSNFNTSKVTIMGEMFSGCNVLSIEGLGNWDVKNVTDMGSMFLHCRGITSLLEISDWDTSSLKSMYRMFMGCNELIELDISNWNASRLETLNETFYDCKKIISFNLGNWDCRRVISISGAFHGCTSLSSITLPKEVSKGCNSVSAFRNCTNLKEVTLPKGVGDIAHIFNNCNNLEKAVIPLDNINNAQDSTFNNCRALIDVDWVGDLSNNFNIISNTGEHVTTESDVHELMTNLGDLKKDKIKISLSKGMMKVNGTEKTIE